MVDIDVQQLHRNLEIASGQVAKCLGMKQGGSGAENNYGAAYQALVRAGEKPQIRKRYR